MLYARLLVDYFVKASTINTAKFCAATDQKEKRGRTVNVLFSPAVLILIGGAKIVYVIEK